jgi:aldose sugar dehydrogenase
VRVIFRQDPKAGSGIHFGSRLVFAPDGMLFVTLGERGQQEEAQSLANHLGTVVRIAPDGSVPRDNPFVGRDGARPEIWSYGHRNVQGAALHPETGDLWTVEHGPRGGDELNTPRAGRNYGWPVIGYGRHYSGERIGVGHRKGGLEQPIHYWDPSIATSGLAFYTGTGLPAWQGSIFVGGLAGHLLSRLEMNGSRVVREERLFEDFGRRIRDVRQGPDGRLYLLTDQGKGELLRVEPVR